MVASKGLRKARARIPSNTIPINDTASKLKPATSSFPVVGVGASAGGLEAFDLFFRQIPPDSGMAFVLVPHLDPNHASILSEILQRSTSMPVVEAQDQMVVAPNGVYLIPPNRDMAIFHGTLQLSVPEQPHGHRMPIDAFLRSLSEDQGEQAIGIILSGTGTDGTLGLRAILGAGGISLVQEPATAKYDGMPTSAIRAGYATLVLPAEKMAAALLADRHTQLIRQKESPRPLATTGLAHILMLLRSGTGHDFSQYKKSTIGRRIERRMLQHNIEDLEVYARYLKANPAEVQSLFKELLINVTNFFRDPDAFVTLEQDILPQLLANKPAGYVFRVWVAGCATGEEAYSLAMLLSEFMDKIKHEFKVQIYSTDLDDDAIAIARAGIYPPNIAQDVAPERLRRFFIKEDKDAGYRIKKEIREMVVFAIQNVIKDPPFTKLDLLSCRNLMIYLEPELQDRLISIFHYALKPGGVLFLSPSESIGNHSEQFSPLSRKWKLYRATYSTASNHTLKGHRMSWIPVDGKKIPVDAMEKNKETHLVEIAKRLLLQSFAPASVVTDMKGNILYVHGDTGKYLRPAPGQATLNVIEMAHEGLQLELRIAIQAGNQGTPTLNRELPVKTNDGLQAVSLSVRPSSSPNADEGFLLVSFQDMAQALDKPAPDKPGRSQRMSGPTKRRIEQLEHDLAYTRENLQVTIEEQQATTEELKSANEEMQSTNEELQSTNEELETSKEELQSINEELVTVNAELHAKIEQLSDMQNDIKNLLDNINVGTIFLDEHLVIRRFTREAARIYRLVPSDVGRLLADIKSDLKGEDLLAEAQVVLDTLAPFEREVRTASGSWYLARIQPYRTLDNVIAGAVLTFSDINKRVAAEAAVQEARELAEGIIDTVHEPLVVLDGSLKVISASRPFYQAFWMSPENTIGRYLYALGDRQWDIPKLRELLENILPQGTSFNDVEIDHAFPGMGHRKMRLNARRIVGDQRKMPLILLAIEDITDRQPSLPTGNTAT